MVSFWDALSIAIAVSFSGGFLLWAVSVRIKDVSIVDIGWGLGFVMVAWAIALKYGVDRPNLWLLLTVLSIWGLRLSVYIARRNFNKPEDFRYAAMRKRVPNSFWWIALFKVFWLQAALMILISLPIIFALISEESGHLGIIALGVLAWLVGFIFEAGGDWQLSRFKSKPENRGKLLTTGLWSLTRHPNYFGDAVQWWGFTIMSIGLGAPWWVVISALIMNFFLVQVSGAKLLEESAMSSRPGYADYAAKTPRFLPRLPNIF